MAVTPVFAVDSDSPVDDTVWHIVTSAAGCAPTVWFRYMDTLHKDQPYLHGKGVTIGLISRVATPESVQGDYNAGYADGQKEIAQYDAIGAPDNLLILADIEASWKPTEAWFRGRADAIRASRAWKAGGIYGAPSAPNFWQPLLQARQTNGNAALMVLWAAQPVLKITAGFNMPMWQPETDGDCKVAVWQYYEADPGDPAANRPPDAYNGLVDLDEVDSEYLAVMWAPPKAVEQPPTGSTPTPTPTPAPAPAPAPIPTPVIPDALHGLVRLAKVQGQVDLRTDKLAIPATFGGPGGSLDQVIVLDTGAFELMLDGATAEALSLPNLGAMELYGVTGATAGYYSQVDITVGGCTFHAVPCVVNPSATFQLFGLRWFVDNHLALIANMTSGAVEFWGPPV